MLARRSFALGAALALIGISPEARAKAVHESPYSYQQTFGSTMRLLKVDLDIEVTKVDAEWGYLQFVYVSSESGERKNRGAFTFVKHETNVTVSLQIPEMPSYHEQLIIDKLKRKLSSEHGEPPPPPPKKKPKKDEDDDDENKPDNDDKKGDNDDKSKKD